MIVNNNNEVLNSNYNYWSKGCHSIIKAGISALEYGPGHRVMYQFKLFAIIVATIAGLLASMAVEAQVDRAAVQRFVSEKTEKYKALREAAIARVLSRSSASRTSVLSTTRLTMKTLRIPFPATSCGRAEVWV